MPKHHHPKRGSQRYWPRKRAKGIRPKVSNWKDVGQVQLVGFLGYKAGMTHLFVKDQNPNSPSKNEFVSCPATIVECPPLKVMGLRFYKKDILGLKLVGELFNQKLEKELRRTTLLPKKAGSTIDDFDDVRAVVYTQPKLTGIGKKKPDIIEIPIGGKTKEEKLEYGKKILNEDIKIGNLFREGQQIDIHSVTKGKGFQGTVKRFGVPIRQHKAEKTKRGIGTLGSWHPNRVLYTVPQSGKMGFHLRTEHNKICLKLGTKPEEINPKGGFPHYGIVRNDYILLKGSVSGPTKRPIAMTLPIRSTQKQVQTPTTKDISLYSKQG